MSDQLRQLAQELRKEAQVRENKKMVKCAQVIQAAQALNLLRQKVSHG